MGRPNFVRAVGLEGLKPLTPPFFSSLTRTVALWAISLCFARAKLKQCLRVGEDNSLAPIRFYLLFYLEDGVGGDGAVGGGVEALDGGQAHAVGAGLLDIEIIFYGVGT